MKLVSQRHFRFVLLSLVMVVALSACGKSCGSKLGGAEQQELKLIPGDSNVIASLDWKKWVASPFGERLQSKVPEEIRPLLQNIQTLTLGLQYHGGDQKAEDFIALVQGSFDGAVVTSQLAEQAKQKGLTLVEEDYKGVKLQNLARPGTATLTFAFLDGIGMVGTKTAVQKSIDLSKKEGTAITENKPLMDLVHNLDQKKMLWAAGIVPAGAVPAADDPAAANSPMSTLSGLQAFDLGVDYDRDLVVDLGVLTKEKAAAEQLFNMATSYKNLFGQTMAQQNPNLSKVLEGITLETKENRVTLHLQVAKAVLDQLQAPAAPATELEAPVAPSVPAPAPAK